MLVSITGPSGVGKTTLLHNLIKKLPEARPLISYTTRDPRPSDEPGEYAYVSKEEFDTIAASGAFLWEAHTYVNRYGTKKEDVDRALAGGFYLPVLVIDAVKKLDEYARSAGKVHEVRHLYILIEDIDELRNRLMERGDSPEEREARIKECLHWNEQARASGVPFIYIQAKKSREEILEETLEKIRTTASA